MFFSLLVIRYLQKLISLAKISFLPHVCKAWTMDSTFSMYSCYIFHENMQAKGPLVLTEWERKKCPWWLDMKRGECLEEGKRDISTAFEGGVHVGFGLFRIYK